MLLEGHKNCIVSIESSPYEPCLGITSILPCFKAISMGPPPVVFGLRTGKILQEGRIDVIPKHGSYGLDSIDDIPLLWAQKHAVYKICSIQELHKYINKFSASFSCQTLNCKTRIL